MNEACQPINYNDYDNLEFAYQHRLLLTLALEGGEVLQVRANDLVSRKNVEYLVTGVVGETRELRLDKVTSFGHPQIGTVMVSGS